jgi:hypothetical protein
VSLDFDREVRDAQALSRDVANAPPKTPQPSTPMLPVTEANTCMLTLGLQPSPSGPDMNRYFELVQQDPNLALAGLRMVEILARNLAKGFKLDISSRDSAGALLRRLLDRNAIRRTNTGLRKRPFAFAMPQSMARAYPEKKRRPSSMLIRSWPRTTLHG